jgi:hypothetical protein
VPSQKAALESRDAIAEALENTDMVFVTVSPQKCSRWRTSVEHCQPAGLSCQGIRALRQVGILCYLCGPPRAFCVSNGRDGI